MKKAVYVVFGEADYRPWYLRGLEQGFSHCYTYEHQLLGGYDCFVKVECLLNTLNSEIFFGTSSQLLEMYKATNIIQITVEVNPTAKTLDLLPVNCVSMVKKQLGVNKPFILTPKQLYAHLVRRGGKEV